MALAPPMPRYHNRQLTTTTLSRQLFSTSPHRRSCDQYSDCMQMVYSLETIIAKWISPPDSSETHERNLRKRKQDTGGWFVASSLPFSQWRSRSNDVLWMHGKPGSGKSVLCSLAVEALNDEPGLAFYHFDSRDPKKCSMYGLLSSLVSQLASRSHECGEVLKTFHSNHGLRPHPNVEQLFTCLESMLHARTPTYIVIDGLDQCPSDVRHKDLYPAFQRISRLRIPGTHLLLSSRLEQDIRQGLAPLLDRSIGLGKGKDTVLYELDLTHAEGHALDIQKCILEALSSIGGWDERIKGRTKRELLSRADGMFLYVSHILRELQSAPKASVNTILGSIPSVLVETYEDILGHISSPNAPLAHRVFQCIAFAERPLSPRELAEVFALQINSGSDFKLRTNFRERDPEASLLSTCSSLIQIIDNPTSKSRVVQFSHPSIRAYLQSGLLADSVSRYRLESTSAHLTLSKLCLSNLLFTDYLSELPFGPYTADYWVAHVAQSEATSSLVKVLNRILDPVSGSSVKWLTAKVLGVEYDPAARSLYCCACLGLDDLADKWLRNAPECVNKPGGPSGTPLCAAARYGHVKVANVLLAHGALAQLAGPGELETPIHHATWNGHTGIVDTLLENGALVDACNGRGELPLHYAARRGYECIARSLLERGAAVDAETNEKLTPLHMAAINNHPSVARELLKHKADVSKRCRAPKDILKRTASLGPSKTRHENTLEPLFESGAYASASDKIIWTPLHFAAAGGRTEVVHILLDHQARTDARTSDAKAPLALAAAAGHVNTMGLLIRRGAAIDARDAALRTPLHEAAEHGHADAVRVLLDRGAAVDAEDESGQTALDLASVEEHDDVVRLIRERTSAMARPREDTGGCVIA